MHRNRSFAVLLVSACALLACAAVVRVHASPAYIFRDWFGAGNNHTSADGVDEPTDNAWFKAYRDFLLRGLDATTADHAVLEEADPNAKAKAKPPPQPLSDKPRLQQVLRSTRAHRNRLQRRAAVAAQTEAEVDAETEAQARADAQAEAHAAAMFRAETEVHSHNAFQSVLRAGVKAGDPTSICTAGVAAYNAWLQANNNAAPNALQLSNALLTDNRWANAVWSAKAWVPSIWLLNYVVDPGTTEVNRIRALVPIVVRILLYRVQWMPNGIANNDLCETAAIEISVSAHAMHANPPGGFLTNFALGLEEENWGVKVEPAVADDKGTLAESTGGVAAPRSSKHFRIEVDHALDANNQKMTITEFITGPIAPVNWAARDLHRAVVNTWWGQLPAPANNNNWAEAADLTSFKAMSKLYNAQCAGAQVPDRYKLYVPWYSSHSVRRINSRSFWPMPNGQRPASPAVLAHMQVNFELSLCALANEPNLRAIMSDNESQLILDSARDAATRYIARWGQVLTQNEWNALSNQHKCELKGLFTLYMMSGLYRGVATLWNANPANTQLGAAIRAAQHWQRIIKNFFNVLVKTNMHAIVPKLPFPLSDIVWRFHRRVAASDDLVNQQNARRAITGLMHADLVGRLAHHGSRYGGNVANTNTPWLDANGDYFNTVVWAFGHAVHYDKPAYGKQSSCAVGGPPANVYDDPNNAGQHQVVLVAEAREIRSPLNRAFMEGHPGHQQGAAQAQVAQLALAGPRYEP